MLGRRRRASILLALLAVTAVSFLLLQSRLEAESLGARQGTLIAVGDIGRCDMKGDELVAATVRKLPGTIAVLGDAVYWAGRYSEYVSCFHPAWGGMKSRIRPVPGNHDYQTPGAAGYFRYFGKRAGKAGEGYYSYNIGSWHIIALNSNCQNVGGCAEGSPQYEWLKADLQKNMGACTLAYWHYPYFNQEPAPDHVRKSMADAWKLMASSGVEAVLTGHTHNYQRFRPLTAAGRIDPAAGMAQFVVGTGGTSLHPLPKKRIATGLAARGDRAYGVLQLGLYEEGYSWRYITVSGRPIKDSGETLCR